MQEYINQKTGIIKFFLFLSLIFLSVSIYLFFAIEDYRLSAVMMFFSCSSLAYAYTKVIDLLNSILDKIANIIKMR